MVPSDARTNMIRYNSSHPKHIKGYGMYGIMYTAETSVDDKSSDYSCRLLVLLLIANNYFSFN